MLNFSKTLFFTGLAACMALCVSGQGLERYRTLKDTSWISKQLGFNKHIEVTVPVEYQQNLQQNFPLIIVFDMQNRRQYHYILNTIDFLTGNERMPSSVIVGVEAGKGGNRYRETQLKVSDSTGIAEANEAYVFKELIPWLRRDCKAGRFVMVIGHSRYGFLTTWLLARHPGELNAAISMSPFIGQPHFSLDTMLTRSIDRASPRHVLYYRYAMGDDYPEDYKKLTAALKAPGFKVPNFNADGWLFPGADHMTTPALTISRALFDIFSYWYNGQSDYLHNGKQDAETFEISDNSITTHYGAPLAFSIATLNGKGYDFYNKEDYRNAITAFRVLVRQYPNFSPGYLSIAKCQKALKEQTSETIRQFRVSLAQSGMFNEEQKNDLLKEAQGF